MLKETKEMIQLEFNNELRLLRTLVKDEKKTVATHTKDFSQIQTRRLESPVST